MTKWLSPFPKESPKRLPRRASKRVIPSLLGEEGLVGSWLFYRGAGSVAKDYSNQGNDGQIRGGCRWVDGPWGWCLDFNGTDGWVEIGDVGILEGKTEYTILLWAYFDEIVAGSTKYELVRKWYTGGRSYSTEIYDGTLRMVTKDSEGNLAILDTITPNAGQWYHFGFVFKANSYSRHYINGSLEAEETTDTAAVDDVNNSTEWLGIGARANEGSPDNFMDGKIAYPTVLDRAMTGSEVERHYERTKAIFGI